MSGITRTLRTMALLFAAGTIVSGNAQQSTQPQAPPDPFVNSPLALPQWNPMLDEMRALPEAQQNVITGQAIYPMAATTPAVPFGGFRVAPSTPAHAAGDASRQISAVGGDFNRDGCQDVVSFQTQSLTVMNGDCTGNFTKSGSQATALNVFQPVAVDLNHDGYPDIVAMTLPFGYAGTVVAMLNQKNGTFAAPVVISKPASTYSGLMDMNVYDVNGDGNYDIVVSGVGTVDAITNTNLVFEVIFGNPDGTFRTSTQVESLGTLPYKPVFAYGGGTALRVVNGQLYLYGLLNQSERLYGITFASEPIYRWPVNTSGKIDTSSPQIISLPVANNQPTKYLHFADLNGDGIDDLTVMNADGMLYTALGAPDGSFGTISAALPPSAGNNAANILFQDVNGDGKVDAIIAGASFVGVWPGNGDGTFGTPKVTYAAGFATNAVQGLVFPVTNHVISDFNGDGIPDVAFFDTVKRALNFYKGKSDGTFNGAPALVSTNGNYPSNGLVLLATPDLNGDGIKDVIVNSLYGILSGISDGKGNYTWQVLSQLASITSLSANTTDFNKDGYDDIAFTTQDGSSYYHLWIGYSNGDGTITAKEQNLPFQSKYSFQITVGDINGDGYPDLALALNNYLGPSYGVWAMLNDGKGALVGANFLNAGVTVYGAALADLDKDGKADLILSSGSYSATKTAVYPGTATGIGSTQKSILQSTLPGTSILMGDFNRDGNMDAVLTIASGTSEGLILYNGKGDGTFAPGAPLVSGLIPSYVNTADLNGDGFSDLYFTSTEAVLTDANDSLFGLVVLLNAGNGAFAAPLHYAIYGASSPVLPVDPLRTGSPSLLAGFGGSGTTVLTNNGATQLSVTAASSSITTITSTTATVNVSPFFNDQPVPTGYVDLLVDGSNAGRLTLASNGTATFNLSGLAAGTHALKAMYEGDATYNVNNNSGGATVTVTKAVPVFSFSADASSLALQSNGSSSVALSLSANNAFGGPVALACLGAPAFSTCSFSQNTVTLAPGQTARVALTLASTNTAHLNRLTLPGGGILLCGLLLAAPLARRRRLFAGLLLTVVSLAMSTGLSGCAKSTPSTVVAGTYAVTVNATPIDTTISPQSVTIMVSVNKN